MAINGMLIECRDGWKQLYQPVIDAIKEHDDVQTSEDKKIGIAQIKEKWGALEIYPKNRENMPEKIREMILKASNDSKHVCEYCGTKENVGTTMNHWYKTCCKSCWEKKISIYNEDSRWKLLENKTETKDNMEKEVNKTEEATVQAASSTVTTTKVEENKEGAEAKTTKKLRKVIKPHPALFMIFAEYLGYVSPLIEWAEAWCEGKTIAPYKKKLIKLDAMDTFHKMHEEYDNNELYKWWMEFYDVALMEYETTLKNLKEEDNLPF